MTDRRAAAVIALEGALGHAFADRQLLEAALTHASVGEGGKAVRHNERLEFLGDRVLNLLAAERLLESDPGAREGQMSPKLAGLVNGRTCARVARRLGLGEALRLSAGESKSGGRDKDTILGDALEAVIAALYIDGGLEAARALFLRAWAEEFDAAETPGREPKTELQEWAQGRGLALPAYAVVAREGPDHAPAFTVEVRVEGCEPARAQGRSRQDAEKAAALMVLGRLKDEA